MLYLFNTNIVPDECLVRVSKVSPGRAKQIVWDATDKTSAIGHEATAQVLTELFGIPVAVNRINAQPQAFDKAISLKINGRLPEGDVLTVEKMEEIGYQFFLLEYYPSDYVISPGAEYHLYSEYY